MTKYIQQKPKVLVFLAIFLIVVLYQSIIVSLQVPQGSLAAKQEIVRTIKTREGQNPVSILYDTDLGLGYGFEYLINLAGINQVEPNDSVRTYWISIPKKRFPSTPDLTVHNLALGFPETTNKIFSTKEIILYGVLKTRIPKSWSTTICPYLDFDKYLLTDNQHASCNSFEYETQGIVIAHLPDCVLSDLQTFPKVKIDAPIIFNSFPASLIPNAPVAPDFTLLATSFESTRCIVVADLSNLDMLPLSTFVYDMLQNLKQIE